MNYLYLQTFDIKRVIFILLVLSNAAFGADSPILEKTAVAARAFDSNPELIIAKMLQQGGGLRDEDRIKIVLSPFNDKRSGYAFLINRRNNQSKLHIPILR
jgi:hypothetical protein